MWLFQYGKLYCDRINGRLVKQMKWQILGYPHSSLIVIGIYLSGECWRFVCIKTSDLGIMDIGISSSTSDLCVRSKTCDYLWVIILINQFSAATSPSSHLSHRQAQSLRSTPLPVRSSVHKKMQLQDHVSQTSLNLTRF